MSKTLVCLECLQSQWEVFRAALTEYSEIHNKYTFCLFHLFSLKCSAELKDFIF